MPLIIITGLPSSGKSTRAAQLHAYLSERIHAESAASTDKPAASVFPSVSSESRKNTTHPTAKPRQPVSHYRLHLVSDDSLRITRSVYDLSLLPAHARSANAPEKDARASICAAVRRALSARDMVVLDGLNYIKGWRYQLFCEAKNSGTTCCVLQVGCAVERAREVNEGRLRRRGCENWERGKENKTQEENDQQLARGVDDKSKIRHAASATNEDQDNQEPYSPSNWENLVFRYEEPNPMSRWDSPLFTLIWDDDAAKTKCVFERLWDAVAGDKKRMLKPNMSTIQRGAQRPGGGDFLYVLERETQDIVKRVLEGQGTDDGAVGAEVRVPFGGGGGRGEDDFFVVELPGKVALPQLQRYRRAFVGLNRGGVGLERAAGLDVEMLRKSFVDYLKAAFGNDK